MSMSTATQYNVINIAVIPYLMVYDESLVKLAASVSILFLNKSK
jgi:hypothetical protein